MGVVIRVDVIVEGRVLDVALITQSAVVRRIVAPPAARRFTLKHFTTLPKQGRYHALRIYHSVPYNYGRPM